MNKPERQGHTEIPWEFQLESKQLPCFKIFGEVENNTQFGKLCTPIAFTFTDSDMAKANAAFIVKCVNSHDNLVESLKNLRDMIRACGLSNSPLFQKKIDVTLQKANEVLEEAGEI